MIRSAAQRYNIPANIYAAILMQESSYRQHATNISCGIRDITREDYKCVIKDMGIAQINYNTAKHYKFNFTHLFNNLQYSVNAGAQVLSWFHKTYAKKEPKTWWTRYNCGTRSSTKRATCQKYLKDVNRWR